MLTQRPDRGLPLRRHDAGRLFVAAAVLILAVTAIFSVDIVPSGLGPQVGQVPKDDILAPRTLTITSDIQTKAAQDTARAQVPPQYDYTTDRAADVAMQVTVSFERTVAPVNAAFDASVAPKDRPTLLESALPTLHDDEARQTLLGLSRERWKAVHDDTARVLDLIERA